MRSPSDALSASELFTRRRDVCAIEVGECEIWIERDRLVEVRDGIREPELFLEIASGEKFLSSFFGGGRDGNLAVCCRSCSCFVWFNRFASRKSKCADQQRCVSNVP
jgi:hypothetical protein